MSARGIFSHRGTNHIASPLGKKNSARIVSINGTHSPLPSASRTPVRSISCTRPLKSTPVRPSRVNTAVAASPRKASAPSKLISAIGGSIDSLPDSVTVRRKISAPVKSSAQNSSRKISNNNNNNNNSKTNYNNDIDQDSILSKSSNQPTKRTSSSVTPINPKKKFSAPAKLADQNNSQRISKDHSGSSSGQSSNSGSKGGGSSAGGADGGKVKRGFPVFSEGQLPTVKEEKKSKGKYKKMATDNAVDDIPQELEASASKHTTVFYPTDPIPEAPSHEVFEVASSLDTTAISTTITTTAAANEECSLVPASMLVNSHDEAFIEKNDLEKMVSDLIKNNESKKQEIAALKMENNRLKEAARERLQQLTPPLETPKIEFPTKANTGGINEKESTSLREFNEENCSKNECQDLAQLEAMVDSLSKENLILRDHLRQLGVSLDASPLSDQQKEMILSRVSALSQNGENMSSVGGERDWDNKSSSSISEISVACLQGRIQQMEETHYSTNEELQATLQELEDVREQITECQLEIQQLQEEKQVILESLTQQTEKLNEARSNNDTLKLMLIQQSENSQDVSQCEKTQRLMELLKSVQEDKELVQIKQDEFEQQMHVSKEAEEHFHRETQLIRDRMKLLESMVEAANSDKKNAEKQSQESQEIIKATQKEVERLKSALNAAKEKITEMEAAVISGEKSELADVLERVCSEKEASEREAARLQRRVNHLMCENDRLKDQVAALQENLRVTRNNAKTNLDDVEWRRTQLDERRRELEIEMESLKATAAEAQITCQRHLEDKRELKASLSEVQKKLAEMNERHAEVERTCKEEKAEFKKQVEEWEQFQKDLLTSVRVANDFKTEAQKNLEKIEQENQMLKERLRHLDNNLEKARASSLLPGPTSNLGSMGSADRRLYKGFISSGEGILNERRNNPRPLARGDSRVKSLIESIECATKQSKAGSRSSSTSSIASNGSENNAAKAQFRRADAEGVLRNLPLSLSAISPLKEASTAPSVGHSSPSPLRALNCNSMSDALSSSYSSNNKTNQNNTNLPDTIKMSQLSNEKNSNKYGNNLVESVNKPVSILSNKLEPIRRNSYSQLSVVDKKDPLASLSQGGGSKRNALLKWCQNKTLGYKNVDITNFSSSWNDGLAFCALLDTYMPEKINYSSLNLTDKRKNFEIAFSAAESVGIPTILDINDMITLERPTWQSVFNYVTSVYSHFET